MKRKMLGSIGLLLVAATLLAATGTQILLEARDLKNHPLAGFRFSYEEVKSKPTNRAGATELDLPPKRRTGQQIKIQLVPSSKQADEWFLVNPDVNIPNESDSAAVVLMRRSEFRQIAAATRDIPRVTVDQQRELTSEDKKRVLIEVAARHGLTAEQLETAIRSFAETQDPKDRGIAAYLESRYSLAEELLNKAVENQESGLAETMRYLGATQYEQAKYHAATASFRKALALRGEDADLLSWLGESLAGLAEWPEAESLLRRALAIAEKGFGAEDSKVAEVLNNLGTLLYSTNRFAEAEPLLRRALAIDEKILGAEHPKVAIILNDLAMLLYTTNRLAEAEPLLRRALAIDEKILGAEHPNVAIILNDLAALLYTANRNVAEAETLWRRALAINETALGTAHPEVARDLTNLAALLQVTNRMDEAEPLLRRALAIDEKNFGPDHPEVASLLNNLAALHINKKRMEEAEPLLRRALAIDEKSLGMEHPSIAPVLSNLALVLEELKRLAEAEPLIRRALTINEKSYGPDHPEVATSLNNLADLLRATSRMVEAEPLMRRALAIDEKSLGPDHPYVAIDLNNLAQLLQATNRLADAEPLMRRAVTIVLDFSRRTGHEHQRQKEFSEKYRELLKKMGKPDAEIDATIEALRRPPE